MLTFAAAVFLLLITPGPGVLSTAGIGSAFGLRPGVIYVAGLFVGSNIVAFAVISGLAAVVLSMPTVRLVLVFASAAYLLYLGARIAFAGSKIAFIESKSPPGPIAAMFLQTINPKAYAVNTTLFMGFPFAPENLLYETVVKLIILSAIWIPIHLAWLWAGASLHRLDLSDRAHRRINYLMAASMLLVVALALGAGLQQG